MVAKTSIYYDIVTEFQNKGAKQAETSFTHLTKKAQELAKGLGLAFGAVEIIKFGKEAVKLAAEENKQFTLLGNTLKNIGLGFASTDAKSFIESTALATGNAVDTLIPAYQTLLVATGNVAQSQKDFQLAMDVAAGTGNDLGTVTDALAKGYLGNTKALKGLGAGLDATILKTGRMDLITKQLATTWKGSAALAANSTAGKMARITEATKQATQAIGEGLISAFNSLAGSGSINNSTNQIVKFGKAIGDAIAGIGDLATKVRNTPYLGDYFARLFKGIANTSALLTVIKLLDKVHASTITDPGPISPTVQAAIDQGNLKAQAQALALANARKKAELAVLAAQKQQTIEQKNQALLKILGTVQQDFEKANIMAALAHAQTQEVKDQLQYQLLLLQASTQTGEAQTRTIDNAIILKEKMLLAQGQVLLIDGSIVNLSEAKNPFAGFDKYVQDALNAILKLNEAILSMPSVMPGGYGTYGGSGILPGYGTTYGPGIGAQGDTTTSSGPSAPIGRYGVDYGPGIGASTGQTVSLNISLDPGLIINTTNASTANGSPVTINRLSNQFASV
jgi:hypothetical protein